jgi:hypothetical protein
MDTKTYCKHLQELQRIAQASDWIHILSIEDETINVDIKIEELSLTANIQLELKEINGQVLVDARLMFPNIEHPNIGHNGYVCIGHEDKDWEDSLILLIWGVAGLLVTPNFDDPLVGCCRLKTIESYLSQPGLSPSQQNIP